DDVAEQGQQRSQLVRPDGRQRQPYGFEDLGHVSSRCPRRSALTRSRAKAAAGGSPFYGRGVAPWTRIWSPSNRLRTDSNGPVTTTSPSDRPSRISKWRSPAMPIVTGTNVARPSRMAKTP